ncbi:MAG: hypothetical protein IPM34_12145 [Saprospiraceae bacterium]|nr:hypothetical protein [Saprospiraceae bacterium]
MKRTNFNVFESVSCFAKTLITGVFLLVFLSIAMHGSAQSSPITPESVLPPLKSKTECVELAKGQSALLLEQLKKFTDRNDPGAKPLIDAYNGYQFVLNEANEPSYEMPQILALLWPVMHPDQKDGSFTNTAGFFAKSWNNEFKSIVNQFKK